MVERIVAVDKKHLEQLILGAMDVFGNECDLNYIDTSKITDMWGLFYNSPFNGDISNWDVSNVTNMKNMFSYSQFNGNIKKWDVSSVRDMEYLFAHS